MADKPREGTEEYYAEILTSLRIPLPERYYSAEELGQQIIEAFYPKIIGTPPYTSDSAGAPPFCNSSNDPTPKKAAVG